MTIIHQIWGGGLVSESDGPRIPITETRGLAAIGQRKTNEREMTIILRIT